MLGTDWLLVVSCGIKAVRGNQSLQLFPGGQAGAVSRSLQIQSISKHEHVAFNSLALVAVEVQLGLQDGKAKIGTWRFS
ncbi:hypothetical protein CEP68_07810 [Brevundimonas vesicularis]|uniref:Uncharacterized protein n=1 Tax=Brevundimonas vesicularis TaxID=41276 RepID=A0A1Z3U818_BREVE|nr:hypothetical protein CEP68_07810 [Brevundimonas vesicularis]